MPRDLNPRLIKYMRNGAGVDWPLRAELRQRRKALHLTQIDVCNALGIGVPTLIRWERIHKRKLLLDNQHDCPRWLHYALTTLEDKYEPKTMAR